MNADMILKSDLIDLIFERRNKDYGAYQLRKLYNKHLLIAICGPLLLLILRAGGCGGVIGGGGGLIMYTEGS